ncbi:MAG: orotidine-5'-phosphate decarboxylase [Bacillota bacterium]
MEINPARLIIALDLPDPERALMLVKILGPLDVSFKVGLELFIAGGPSLVSELTSRYRVFLDLKFHDIPNTAGAAVREAAKLGVWMLNLHASGGRDMMLAARRVVEGLKTKPMLLAVTVLTSMSCRQLAETGNSEIITERVRLLSKLAYECSMDGVVCSPLEIAAVKKAVSTEFITVTPGVRPIGADRGDQSRTGTPADVIRAGGDYLVVGRPVTGAADPLMAAENILAQMGESYE